MKTANADLTLPTNYNLAECDDGGQVAWIIWMDVWSTEPFGTPGEACAWARKRHARITARAAA